MTLATLLITLKLATVFVAPRSSKPDDQQLAACVVAALNERPSELTIAKTKQSADALLTIGTHGGLRPHVTVKLTDKSGKALDEVSQTPHWSGHSLCPQAVDLLDELARKLLVPRVTESKDR